jgi:murein DD-endopeptidase MepM/ murein hydrolase activator NlpD
MPAQPNTDAQQGVPGEAPAASVDRSLRRYSAALGAQADADAGRSPSPSVTGTDGSRTPLFAPHPPGNRLLGSPLDVGSGPNVVTYRGNPVRRVSSGWGEARSTGYDELANRERAHHGLDFPGTVGEPVRAVYDGLVTFVGVQRRTAGSVALVGATAQADGSVRAADGTVIAPGDIGFGGLFVQVTHAGAYQGYQTEYMHLSAVPPALRRGSQVHEGDVIGSLGVTGGNAGVVRSGPHLHFQVRASGRAVPAEGLVLHYNPRRPQEAPGADLVAETLAQIQQSRVTSGQLTVYGQATDHARAEARAAAAEGQDRSAQFLAMADSARRGASAMDNEASRTNLARDRLGGASRGVTGATLFDFAKGLWTDGRPL